MKLIVILLKNKKMSILRRILGIKPKLESLEFVEKFMYDVIKRHVQMEIYHNERIILQVQSLQHVGFWFDCDDLQKKKFKDGYILFFFLKNKGLEKNRLYINFENTKGKLSMFKYDNSKNNIKYFLHFFEKNVSPHEIDTYIKKVLTSVYKFPESNPQILFNLRYLKTVTE